MAEVCFSEFKHPACVTEIYAKAILELLWLILWKILKWGCARVLQVCSGAHPFYCTVWLWSKGVQEDVGIWTICWIGNLTEKALTGSWYYWTQPVIVFNIFILDCATNYLFFITWANWITEWEGYREKGGVTNNTQVGMCCGLAVWLRKGSRDACAQSCLPVAGSWLTANPGAACCWLSSCRLCLADGFWSIWKRMGLNSSCVLEDCCLSWVFCTKTEKSVLKEEKEIWADLNMKCSNSIYVEERLEDSVHLEHCMVMFLVR